MKTVKIYIKKGEFLWLTKKTTKNGWILLNFQITFVKIWKTWMKKPKKMLSTQILNSVQLVCAD